MCLLIHNPWPVPPLLNYLKATWLPAAALIPARQRHKKINDTIPSTTWPMVWEKLVSTGGIACGSSENITMQPIGTSMKTTAKIAISRTAGLLAFQIANAMVPSPVSTIISNMTAAVTLKDIVSCDHPKFRNFHKEIRSGYSNAEYEGCACCPNCELEFKSLCVLDL